jgi:TRAP-type C4-dicarboxylate transport system permease small subunit
MQSAILTSPLPVRGAGWPAGADAACIAVLNLGLAAEVAIVFLNTVLRPFHATLMPGMDETARLLLVCLAFLGGAVAYGRGQFMAITVLADRLPPRLPPTAGVLVDWLVIVTAAAIGRASIPLQVLNAGETTTMLGIGYV